MKHLQSVETLGGKRGVFWIIDDTLFAFPFFSDFSIGVSKSGYTYNHEKLWKHVCPKEYRGYPFDYFPRGRVEFTGKGKPVIYMNPHVDEKFISEIQITFELKEQPVVKYDCSEHYKCSLDRMEDAKQQ